MEADNQIGNSCTFQRLKKIPMLKVKTNNRGMILFQMKKSLFGEKYMHLVYELNRLCTNDNLKKNANSFFFSNCIKLLPKPIIIVSYADQIIGHSGYIYQASNFLYT